MICIGMLKLKHTPHLDFPHISLPSLHDMEFSPVSNNTNDELLNDVVEDNEDNNWKLDERPDTDKLVKFWEEVQTDVQSDPEWFTFTND